VVGVMRMTFQRTISMPRSSSPSRRYTAELSSIGEVKREQYSWHLIQQVILLLVQILLADTRRGDEITNKKLM
jgi:hypothetical protein